MSKTTQNYGIHWFRRDLRVAGNPALQENWKKNDGRVVGLFCFDKKFLSRDDFSVNRFQFFIESLKALKDELQQAGSDLLFLDEGPHTSFEKLFCQFKDRNIHLPTLFTWNKDYEPFAIERDQSIIKLLDDWDISQFSCNDHLLIEPHEVTKKGTDDEYYQVFTPFSRQWLNVFNNDCIQQRIKNQDKTFDYLDALKNNKAKKIFCLSWQDLTYNKLKLNDSLSDYDESNKKKINVEIPEAGSLAAYACLETFAEKINRYKDHRDIPSIDGTSQFSFFLKNGSLNIAQIIAYLKLKAFDPKNKSQKDAFFNELIWREFYYHILYHHPRVEKEAFKPEYNQLNWDNNEKWFEAWKNGETGFPIVDAAMKQLNTTGWMHNRCRMIVASFLCKDLLIDWRWGEQYFMEKLLDGDLAPNNGGWQWSASTGCDAQPYFRIFNPWSQSKKFDADGHYIKQYLPQLEQLDAKLLHNENKIAEQYIKPIVDHKTQREKALKLYKEISNA
ncbi:DNA photolyase family protein [bacterium]|nr:DNA photolyase family protein [bacterium]